MAQIVVSGAIANKPGNGGAAWTRMSWVMGLQQLGHEVYFIEQIATSACASQSGRPCELEQSVNLAYFRQVIEHFGLADRSALVLDEGPHTIGIAWDRLVEIAGAADLLVNISGHLTLQALKPRFRRRIFIDLDPGYTQFWYVGGLAHEPVRDHHLYFTIGENIGRPDCLIPTGDLHWRRIRQPIVLDEWPVPREAPRPVFTTVASWRGPYGRVGHNGAQFGLKAHEFRKFLNLPTLTGRSFEIALDVHPMDHQDTDRLRAHGWALPDPAAVAGDPVRFRQYVQQSRAEFSVAQGIYVETRSGWFSDRTLRYLASGRPALVQDTGIGHLYPVGLGLVTFSDLDEAVRGVERIERDYERHAQEARAIAKEFFDSDKVLSDMLATVARSA